VLSLPPVAPTTLQSFEEKHALCDSKRFDSSHANSSQPHQTNGQLQLKLLCQKTRKRQLCLRPPPQSPPLFDMNVRFSLVLQRKPTNQKRQCRRRRPQEIALAIQSDRQKRKERVLNSEPALTDTATVRNHIISADKKQRIWECTCLCIGHLLDERTDKVICVPWLTCEEGLAQYKEPQAAEQRLPKDSSALQNNGTCAPGALDSDDLETAAADLLQTIGESGPLAVCSGAV